VPKLRNQVSATGQAGSANSIALSQSVALGAAALINGALLGAYPVPSNANITQGGPLGQHLEASSGHPVMTAAALLVPAQNVLITSAGNDSGVNFTIRGYDYGGSPISEVIAGSAGAPGTVTSALLYAVVLSVTASAATASTITIGTAILVESGVSFLGLGVQPPTASWGKELRVGFTYLEAAPLFAIAPGVMISLAIISFNFVGDGLRDALDPRLRGTSRVQK